MRQGKAGDPGGGVVIVRRRRWTFRSELQSLAFFLLKGVRGGTDQDLLIERFAAICMDKRDMRFYDRATELA